MIVMQIIKRIFIMLFGEEIYDLFHFTKKQAYLEILVFFS